MVGIPRVCCQAQAPTMPSGAQQVLPAPQVAPSSTAAGPTGCGAAEGQEGLILCLVCSFGPQATSVLLASANNPGEEEKALVCSRQPLPAPPWPSCGAGRISEQPKCSVITHTWQRTSSIVSKRHHVLPCFGEHRHPSPVLEVQSEETSLTLPVLLPTPWPLHLSQGLPTSWPQGTPHARRRRQQAGCYVAACKAGRNQGDSQHGGDR